MLQATLFNDTVSTYSPRITTRGDLYGLIYGNGGNCPATIIFHSDGGHGWLQVPHYLLRRIGIDKKISQYSYRDNTFAYLEEDCDLSAFVTAMGISDIMKDFWEICPNEYVEESPIRYMKRY